MLNFSQLKELGRIPKKNPTLTTATLDSKVMKMLKNVSSLKKSTLLKITTLSESLELTKSDKMMKPIKNSS